MNTSVLHITNGDSTTNYLQKLKFSGNFITWREMLCEGKTNTDVGSETFWKTRFDFFKASYKVSKKKFIDYTVKEYRKLCNTKQSKQIVLWFEYDLFCQINMLAVISWLKRYRKGYQISLVCSGKVEGTSKLLGLAELSKEQILQHYKNKIELTQNDIEYADYIWQLYCSDSPLRLETVYKLHQNSPFTYLATALENHLQRFPSIKNGLNNIENFILTTANKSEKLSSKNKLIATLLKEQNYYGFGDVQYEHKINKLQALFTSFNPIKITKQGKKVLNNQINFYSQLRDDFSYLGGTKKYSFLYNNQSKKLLQITS